MPSPLAASLINIGTIGAKLNHHDARPALGKPARTVIYVHVFIREKAIHFLIAGHKNINLPQHLLHVHPQRRHHRALTRIDADYRHTQLARCSGQILLSANTNGRNVHGQILPKQGALSRQFTLRRMRMTIAIKQVLQIFRGHRQRRISMHIILPRRGVHIVVQIRRHWQPEPLEMGCRMSIDTRILIQIRIKRSQILLAPYVVHAVYKEASLAQIIQPALRIVVTDAG